MLTMTCSIDSGASLLKEFCHDLISSIKPVEDGTTGPGAPGSQEPWVLIPDAHVLCGIRSESPHWRPGLGLFWEQEVGARLPGVLKAGSAVGESVCSGAPSLGLNPCSTALWLFQVPQCLHL